MTLSCFELGERMLDVDQARQAILGLAEGVLESESQPLTALHGRVLAADVVSPIDVPQHTNAAMDGIALAWTGTVSRPARWRQVGEVFAGMQDETWLAAGECVAITTGAPLPKGADSVIMREQLRRAEDDACEVSVDRPERVKQGQNVRRAGEDIARGEVALRAGTRLTSAELGVMASLGIAEADVVRRPRVAVFSTGNEVTAPGASLPAAGIFDANRFSLAGLVGEHGGEVVDLGILPDDQAAIAHALQEAASHADLVLTSGGVSVGDADHTRAALMESGDLGFWKVAIRPGRPLACGRLGCRGVPFLGLPGNPVAAMVTFLQFVAPLLARFQGRPESPRRLTAIAEHAMKTRLGRADYLRGRYHSDGEGRLRVEVTGAQGSGILSSMVMANCLIEITTEREAVDAGDVVIIQPLFRYP
ncbi:gephyrin-like molybdotransferase Glp [Halomonas urumqiensis]|uniref:Molybdopterin molybdenumtransferase n=1 Tax=Halomonas urumqiensis TaxID=1684789 RepID=A0A2N7ULQ5_9GAMM|nr:gephyrin-like molybdotransferase Glp [Halomonas urumqiensis]PMR81365.1 molybdopterin molybdenumtransferase MoeA [Halomonas urumqiensis]PTB01165.1 molybdopterin molybdenumtransferase MoeA [Halomonas urumqiensis]GHE22734.1 hypothetical protein GCM10017767_32550 [Halomonas urumqiensis]